MNKAFPQSGTVVSTQPLLLEAATRIPSNGYASVIGRILQIREQPVIYDQNIL